MSNERSWLPGRVAHVSKTTADLELSVLLIGFLICPMSVAANGQGRERPRSSETSSRIVAGTVVDGDIAIRTLRAALETLPRRPERIVVMNTETALPEHEKQLHDLDAFVPIGSRVIYLRRQGATLIAAEYWGGPCLLMLAVVIWHEMAHVKGLDERQAQQWEEDLWKDFVQRGMVESGLGLTYLSELRRRR